MNRECMKDIFHKTTNLRHRPFIIKVNQNNTTKHGNKTTNLTHRSHLI